MGDGMIERVTTGVMGFDALVEGGLPKGSNVLITGAPGAGKTIFGLHYLYSGAMAGERGLYISLDSHSELLKEQALQFGMDFSKLEAEDKVVFLNVPINQMKFDLFDAIKKAQERIGAKRVVFDSMAMFAINIDLFTIPIGYVGNTASSVSLSAGTIEKLNAVSIDDKRNDVGGASTNDGDKISYTANSEKRMIYLIVNELSRFGTTNIIITYGDLSGATISNDGVSEYICDGIVQLYNDRIGIRRMRTISILKMRYTNHSPFVHDFAIGNRGIEVRAAEQVYK